MQTRRHVGYWMQNKCPRSTVWWRVWCSEVKVSDNPYSISQFSGKCSSILVVKLAFSFLSLSFSTQSPLRWCIGDERLMEEGSVWCQAEEWAREKVWIWRHCRFILLGLIMRLSWSPSLLFFPNKKTESCLALNVEPVLMAGVCSL